MANLDQALTGADCAAIVTKRHEYFELTPQRLRSLMRTLVVVDGRNVLGFQADDVVMHTIRKG